MLLSIIVTSQDRPKELKRYFETINKQKNINFSNLQIIFVDQGDNKSIYDNLSQSIIRKYVKYHKCGLSEARNQGLKFVIGDIVAFGDDDSWYDDDTLSKVFDLFEKRNIDGVGTAIKNESDVPYNKYPQEIKKLTYLNHYGLSSASIFLQYDSSVSFDVNIGVGSKFNLLSGEETDYLWTYMERHPNFVIEFHPEITVRHPVLQKQNFNNYLDKCYYYARGFGYIMKKHSLPATFIIQNFLRPFMGIFVYLLVNNFRCRKSYYILKGRMEGYLYNIKNLDK